MLISHPEFKTSACCVLILTIMVANSASGAALEGQVDDRSTEEEHQDWRQPLPTVKRAVALLNKLVMVANRANNNKKQRYQQANPLIKHQGQSPHLNYMQHREGEQLPNNSAENIDDNHHHIHQKAIALPRMGFERRGQSSQRVFWRCYFNAVSCFR
ncbi:uncharacterized protein LOC124350812 [Daphnia pulicaria]|uniref:uncharacterized protein LOC124350812 n=1 Tax=Daphnia pulicaria TaxID=35523 RepID=UPI001EEB19EC|nr:uncharacterized protein LOC124350812 [Daphnia pulicaria]